MGAALARDHRRVPVSTPDLDRARAALDDGDTGTAVHWLKEARRVAVAQRRLDELLAVHDLAQTTSPQLAREIEVDLASFAPAA